MSPEWLSKSPPAWPNVGDNPLGEEDTTGQNATGSITAAEALAYELQVKEVMRRSVLVGAPSDRVAQLLELCQQRQTSEALVVREGKLVGAVSLEDLVRASQRDDPEWPISAYITPIPVTVRPDDLVIKAVKLFSQTTADHLPVVDETGQLAGTVTRGDVTSGLLKALERGYQEEDVRRYRASHLFEDIVSDRTSLILRYRVQARDFASGGMASARVRQALLRLGASLDVARRCAIAVYEAEMNLVIHTVNGGILRVEVQPHMILMEALDDGPGIEDIELAMQPGYTTTPDEIRMLGFGAGFGLNNIKRCVDRMWLQSTPGEGTRLEMWIYLQPGAEYRRLETVFDRLSS